ncbi:MAG: sigma-70 family RNA polymerase sigma factor [Ruminococcaceae bacterium]|nr:sigma-70 family RNA polymerase sigma factor [Oscillospiraceae bacterium]
MDRKGGEEMADFEKLYKEKQVFIFKFLMKICKDESLAEELTQETFFRAYMNISNLRSENAASVWLCQIAKNCYFSWYNQNKNLYSLENLEGSQNLKSLTDPENEFLQKELSNDLYDALSHLEEPYKEVFILHVMGNMTMKEISETFGKSESWARVTFYRGRQKLSEILDL